MKLGIEGYLTFEPVEAGSQYFDSHAEEYNFYKYSGIYFINFVEKPQFQEDINCKF